MVLATLQREQLSSPMTIFLKFSDVDAAEVAPLVKKGLSSGISVKSTMDDLKAGSLSGCDSDRVTKGAALTMDFSAPRLELGRATLPIHLRSCAIDARSADYTFLHLGYEWSLQDIKSTD